MTLGLVERVPAKLEAVELVGIEAFTGATGWRAFFHKELQCITRQGPIGKAWAGVRSHCQPQLRPACSFLLAHRAQTFINNVNQP